AEELRRERHIEAGPVVADEVRGSGALLDGAEFDPGVRLSPRELPRIVEQVLDRRAEERAVALLGQSLVDDDLDDSIRLRFLEPPDGRTRERAQVHALMADADARDTAQVEQAVDEPAHVLGGLAHAPEVLLRLGIERLAVVLEERVAEAIDT